MKDFRKLAVWEKAHALTLMVYQIPSFFPRDELWGLRSQIRRACVSIPANIAEGCGKEGDAEFSRYLRIAMGSSSELEYELLLAHDLRYLDEKTYQSLGASLGEVRRMLNSLIQKVKADNR